MTENRYSEQFYRLKDNQFALGKTDYKSRIAKLKILKKNIEITYKQRLREALYQDFKKPQLEVDFTEIYPVIDEINHVVHNLKFWLKRQKVPTPISLFGSSSYIKYEPKGVCLIISPWNFPLNLTFGPLVSAIAAGNPVVLKPSEMTPKTTEVMEAIINSTFGDDEVILIKGNADVAIELQKLPFNHIYFTGSPAVGKMVMKAASEHLTSVTLELGGKSPTIIDSSVNLEKVAKKIAFGKFLNAGQTCIAPDYLFVEESIKTEFVALLKDTIKDYYGENPSQSKSYSNIINDEHALRLKDLLKDAKSKGASFSTENIAVKIKQHVQPTVVLNVKDDMKLMQEEIFGPILPIKTFTDLADVTDYVNTKEKPLAIYIFSNKESTVNYIIKNTRAGTTCINHNLLQFINVNLPFGGSNNSGIGKGHGFYGFKEFSNQRAILKQHTISAADLIRPPYTNFKQKIIDLTIKWF